jgi:hypothetical protein
MVKKASNTQLVHIRMPIAFHRRLMRDADRSGQTLNAEILRRLAESYERSDALWNRLDAIQFDLKNLTEWAKEQGKSSTVSSTASSQD